MKNSRVAAVYMEYADTVLRAVCNLTDRQTAEDCTQEAFLLLMKQDDSMTDAHILPWVIRTALNLAKNHLKSAEHTRTESLDEHLDTVLDTDEDKITRTVFRALQKVPEHYRVPLYLHIVEGYTVRETAKILGLKLGTAATSIRRGKKLLQAAFREEEL